MWSIDLRTDRKHFSMLLAGDAMPSWRLSPSTKLAYVVLVDLIRGTDLVVLSSETTVHNRDEGEPGWRVTRCPERSA
jgi:hypothetical protein